MPLASWVVRLVLGLLTMLTVSGQPSKGSCRLPKKAANGYIQKGEIVLGGIILVHWTPSGTVNSFREEPEPISCKAFQVRSYREVLVVVFAVEEINRNPTLLPNITLGFRIHDSCQSETIAVASTLSLLSGVNEPLPNFHCNFTPMLLGAVGEVAELTTKVIANILSVFRVPQVKRLLRNRASVKLRTALMHFDV
ncbi:hypothetical protein NDU88_005765 [Pleurodeles waltl]|uniref:Receptor ligand binding region domain-containing protein n=1 Tax=Pleurodeles waltl TaxID=8319 RepID=A0AAV7QFS7_PLEWA|nr:hypothetical protein NDU88_005765 [Pleurodeles waltl]